MAVIFKLLFATFVCCLQLQYCSATWWFVSQLSESYGNRRIHCENIPGLVRRQRLLCERHPDLMKAVAEGAIISVRECQRQFKNSRWNCSTIPRDVSVFGRHVLRSTQEAAFVYSVNSAGVVHAVTRACSRGAIPNCACDPRKNGEYRDRAGPFNWGGCSDNIRYGTAFARRFIDARERRQRDARALVILHNNRAGRKAVRKQSRLECKCHGVSGSCTVRTCWQTLASFSATARWLKTRYDSPVEVIVRGNGVGGLLPRNVNRPLRRTDLVYLGPSPDYCSADLPSGFLGIAGRQCNATSTGSDRCDTLCCGHGYDTKRMVVESQCDCKFQWCCFIVCKTCQKKKELHFCRAPNNDNNTMTNTT